jgi:GntR family transcriptional regulator / MocR family aminotransferase
MNRMPSDGLIPYIPFDRNSSVPFYLQVYDGYRAAIVAGRLAPGQRLPSTRTLADQLQISRFPVLSAFEQLLHDGYLEGKVGSGTFVRDRIPDELSRPITVRKPTSQSNVRPAPLASFKAGALPHDGLGPFRVSLPALDRFPHETFSRLIRHHAGTLPDELLAYSDPAGYLPLREAIAEYLRTARAVDCDPSQVLIVTGSQMGLLISALALSTPDSSVCIEEPGYSGTKQALAIANANVIRIPVDDHGIDVAAIKRLATPVRMVFVTPSHQYPLGVSLEMTRRLELLNWAAHNDAWIVEDDYDSEYRFSSRPLGALQGMDAHGRVIYIGTFSKVLFPALRVGYVVVPHELVARFAQIRESLDIFSPLLYQLVLTDFLKEGHFARHLIRMRSVYLARRNALITAICDHAADLLTLGNTDAGLCLVAYLPDDIDDRDVVRRAARQGLYPQPLSPCYNGGDVRNGLILGFGGSDEYALTSAVCELAEVIRLKSAA